MEQQKSPLIPEMGLHRAEKNEKLLYLAPSMGSILVKLESHIAAGSITVKENDNVVQESWMVEEDDVRNVDLDFFD
ncbi:hypothetical protein [Sphingobacterium chuzhouense]|uniref:Uncharacterized protein n=1 Tax=Sphingobacterium chuzhouense TaxID=1742264 RepID=A0ABR7XTP6_9SPHI|nr:hypothetical protein [Sphingobacterium chuzhouense]MBD1422511.1 hypothetical protein [Sphingobacterium chuzhouense]